jgi:class 3 adenylate cyclase
MEGAQSVDKSQKPKTNKVHPVNNIDKNKKKAIINRAKDKLKIWRHKSRESSTKNNLSSQVSGLMRDHSGTSYAMEEMDTQESVTGVQSRLICHVPDFVWQAEDQVIDTPKAIMTNGVLLFADVSGFTALTERYSNHREGVSGLTHALNGYISAICQKILENGGDILKFAGDAILALWKCDRTMLADCIALATHCSLEIQQNHDWQMTSVGVELRVKIAIAAGKIYCTHVGLPGQVRHIAMSGNPVGEVNAAEKHCESGDVVLSSNAWDLCNRGTFKGFEVGDGKYKFFKVKFMTRKNFSPDEFESWKAPNPYPMISGINSNKKQDECPAREACLLYNNKNLETYIRQYISKTVQEKLDDGQPRDYLSEIRQCTILFINLVFDLKEQRRDYTIKLGNTLQDSFEIVDDELRKKGGQLNKLFMFDKGCTFLAAFGLPGTKNEREAALALECAFKISKRMTNEIIELNRCSIGVTTGSVYVGVIGHEERHEYSFLGPKVNMAARIMMAGYPGMVNCDALTMKCSDLSPDYFIAQAYKPLKGIKDPGVIYQYTETMPPLTSYIRRNVRPEYPILGRIDEIDRIMAETCSGEDRCFVVIEGDKGIGKTRLLEEIVIISQNIDANLHVVNISTSFDIMKDNFKIVRIIIEDLLGIIDQIDRSPNSFAERAILETLKGSKYSRDDYDLINPIFGTYINGRAMRQSQIKLDRDVNLQSEMIEYIMSKCLDNFERSLILIDCAQFIDSMSWKVLNHFANDHRASIVVSYRPQVSADVVHDQHRLAAFNHPDNLHLRLSSLPNEYFPALACQMLRVTQISETLTAGIIYKSFGNPGWTLLNLKSLLDQDLIRITVKGEVEHGQACHEPPKELITSRDHQFAEAAKKAAEQSGAGAMVGSNRHSSNMPNRQSSRLTKQLSKSILNRSMKSTTERGTVYKHPAIKTVLEDDDDSDDDLRKGRSEESTMVNKKAIHQGKQYMDILKKIGGYYEDVLTQGDADPDTERECILTSPIKLPTLLQSIVAPQVIKSFILQQLDRLPPTTQQVAKECALVGEYFSRHIIYHLNSGKGNDSGHSTDKIDRAFQHLIDAKIIEPIRTQINMSRHAKPVQNVPNARKSSLLKQIHVKTDTQCEHLRFINSFYHEVIDNLWLDEQRAYLHKQCAAYFQSCLDELTLNQNVTNKTIIEFAVHRECKRDVSRRQKSVCNILNINIQEFDARRIAFDASRLKHPLLFDNFGVITKTAMTDDWPDSIILAGQSLTTYKEIRALYKKQDRPEQIENNTAKISIR